MLALKSTVDKLQKKYDNLVRHYNACVRALDRARAERDWYRDRWHAANDELAGRVNTNTTQKQFTPEQLRAIRRAFHPDRNPGSKEATVITQICNQALK